MEKLKEKKTNSLKSAKERKLQTIQTVEWLRENYCACPDVCLPREILYGQYSTFCRNHNIHPTCKATFGKLVRTTFPGVTSKRLGARGQSKYHYNGVGIKPTPECSMESKVTEGITRFSGSSSINESREFKIFSTSSKVGTLLPSFPEPKDLDLPSTLNHEKLETFLMMYKMHCQCIIDVAIGGNFEEIRLFLLHFWQGFPEHLLSIFTHEVTTTLLSVCDSIFHRTLMDVLIPKEIMEIPEKLLRGIQNLGSHWQRWVSSSVENMPSQVKLIKMTTAQRFSSSLKRHVAVILLAQVSRPVLNHCTLQELSEELSELEMNGEIINHFIDQLESYLPTSEIAEKLRSILVSTSSIESIIDWIDDFVTKIDQEAEDIDITFRQSLLQWVYELGRISHILTENYSNHFITFHLLSSFVQEYLLLAFENRRAYIQEKLTYSKLESYLKFKGDRSATFYKSPTSCYLANSKKHLLSPTEKSGPLVPRGYTNQEAPSSCLFNNGAKKKNLNKDYSSLSIGYNHFKTDQQSSYYPNRHMIVTTDNQMNYHAPSHFELEIRGSSDSFHFDKLHAIYTQRDGIDSKGMESWQTGDMSRIQESHTIAEQCCYYSQNQQGYLNYGYQLHDVDDYSAVSSAEFLHSNPNFPVTSKYSALSNKPGDDFIT